MTKLQHLIRSDRGPPFFHNLLTELKRVLAEATLERLSGTKQGSWFVCYGPYTHQRAHRVILTHANLKGGRGGISSEKQRRRAAQAPGGTGGRVPHFSRLEPKWLLSLSLSLVCSQQPSGLVCVDNNGTYSCSDTNGGAFQLVFSVAAKHEHNSTFRSLRFRQAADPEAPIPSPMQHT